MQTGTAIFIGIIVVAGFVVYDRHAANNKAEYARLWPKFVDAADRCGGAPTAEERDRACAAMAGLQLMLDQYR
ncbi:MAG: hypothetical protein IPQ15_09720 [Betaproteobacteria bacterium]|nr:hypothetical protein [Betaproteobacteria bacterium]